jgi:dihydroflavonol-4-reductase
MKAVVIGAAGHIGNAIIRALLDRDYEVTACGRRSAPPANLASLSVNYVPGDADKPGQFERLIEGHDLVVDAAAPYALRLFLQLNEKPRDPIADADLRTRRLLNAIGERDVQLAYVSSFVTLASPRKVAERLEAQMMRSAHPYFDMKDLIESQIIQATRQGLRAVIVNPTMCLGPWDIREKELCLIPQVLRGRMSVVSNITLNVIDTRDVALALLAALDARRYGEPILLSAHDIAVQELWSLICDSGGVAAPTFSVPATPAVFSAYWTEVMLGLIGRKSPMPSIGMLTAHAFDYLDSGGKLLELGTTPRPLSETIADSIGWYQQIGYC